MTGNEYMKCSKKRLKGVCLLSILLVLAGCGRAGQGESILPVSTALPTPIFSPGSSDPQDMGGFIPDSLPSDQEDLVKEYTDLSILLDKLLTLNPPSLDFTLGEGNDSFWAKKIDPSCPIFTIFVNPLATEELLEDYTDTALQMDGLLGSNTAYQHYLREHSPYFITFQSGEETICRMDLTGNHAKNEILDEVSLGLKAIQEQAEEEMKNYMTFISSTDLIDRDSSGNAYYVLDSAHISKSLEDILSRSGQIASRHPFESSEARLYAASWEKIGYAEGTFRIYLDEYGGDLITRPYETNDTGEYPFTISDTALYFQVYNNFVKEGDLSPDPSFHCLYFARIGRDGTREADLSFEGNPAGAASFSREEIIQKTYEIYRDLAAAHAAHGIEEFPVLGIRGQCALPIDQGGLWIHISAEVPLTAPISFEEYCDLLDGGSTIFDPRDYEEPADCF